MTKALIIDDSSTVRSIIAKMLRSWGIENVQAENGKEAFDTLTSEPDIGIAFVDWNMPVMSGIQFVRLVRADTRYQDVKLLMVTTETEMPQVSTALEAGVDEYIMKPFTKEMFLEKLKMIGVNALPNSE